MTQQELGVMDHFSIGENSVPDTYKMLTAGHATRTGSGTMRRRRSGPTGSISSIFTILTVPARNTGTGRCPGPDAGPGAGDPPEGDDGGLDEFSTPQRAAMMVLSGDVSH